MGKTTRGNQLMIFFLVYSFVINIIISLVVGIKIASGGEMDFMTMQVIMQLSLFGGFFIFYCLMFQKSPLEILSLKPLSIPNIFLIIGMSMFIQPLISFLNLFINLIIPSTITENVGMLIEGKSFFATIMVVAVAPAILEELIFRGIFMHEFKDLKPKHMIWLSSLFFGLMHLDFHQSIYTTVLGAFLGYLCHISGSFFAPVLGHFVINGSQSVMLYYLIANPADTINKAKEWVHGLELSEDVLAEVMTGLDEVLVGLTESSSEAATFAETLIMIIPMAIWAAICGGIFFALMSAFKNHNEFVGLMKSKNSSSPLNGGNGYDRTHLNLGGSTEDAYRIESSYAQNPQMQNQNGYPQQNMQINMNENSKQDNPTKGKITLILVFVIYAAIVLLFKLMQAMA